MQKVKCNNCDWNGEENELNDELCPKCGTNSEEKIIDIDKTPYTRKEIRKELAIIHGYLDPNEDHDMEDVQNEIDSLIGNI